MTLTFDLAAWFLFTTHRLVMMIICAKLFSYPTMHNKVTGWTRTGFIEVYTQSLRADCDLDIWSSDMVLNCHISSCHDDHLCHIIFKSHHVQLSTAKLWPWHDSGTHTYTHTRTGQTLHALLPFYGRGIKTVFLLFYFQCSGLNESQRKFFPKHCYKLLKCILTFPYFNA